MNQLAVSLAGHDKDSIYAVVGEEDGMLLLADGGTKTLASPKKKNPKHVRRILHLEKGIEEALEQVRQDSDLVYVLRLYQASQKNHSDEKARNDGSGAFDGETTTQKETR